MTAQLSLVFDATIADRFEDFHRDNPRVYNTLVRLAREWVKTTGHGKLGIATLYERARWDIALATRNADYKLNNSYRAYYARLIHQQESDLDGLFDLRASAADSWLAARSS
jgi:hypothetical protein